MNDRPRNQRQGGIFAGVVLIAVGIVFLLETFHVARFDEVVHGWWPMLIVLFGVVRLFTGRRPWGAIWFIAIGAWLQAVQLGLFGLTYHNSWPLLLIVAGAGMTLRAFGDTFRGSTS